MQKQTVIYSDDLSITLSTVGKQNFRLQYGEYVAAELTREQLEELQQMITEILESRINKMKNRCYSHNSYNCPTPFKCWIKGTLSHIGWAIIHLSTILWKEK